VSVCNHIVSNDGYTPPVPKLWTETIEAHRHAVREATLDSAAALAAQHGLRGVTMSQIAEAAGIGRATLYKYFRDVESILAAWHQRQIQHHLALLVQARDEASHPAARLAAVLEAYARIARGFRAHHDTELVAFLHQREKVAEAEHRLRTMVENLISEAAASGDVRADVAPGELADYCLYALGAARGRSQAAIGRLVAVTLAGLRGPV
jgi:AcrR family transcriptional regulator